MRPLEALTMAALLPSLLILFVPERKRPLWSSYLPGVPAAFTVTQLVLEGYRWQMIPAYELSAILLLMAVRTIVLGTRQRRDPPSRRRRMLTTAGTALGLLLSLIHI